MSHTAQLFDATGADKGQVDINPAILEFEKGEQALHETIVAFLAGQRSGTACTKTRAEVRGSNAKPWRQKGTGNARVGTKRNPIWRGGGVAFGPKPRSYAQNINKKVKRLALRRALAQRVEGGTFIVVEDFAFESAKTSVAKTFLKTIGAVDRPTIILNDTAEDFESVHNAFLSFRNISNCVIVGVMGCNAYDILSGKKVIITKSALDVLVERIG